MPCKQDTAAPSVSSMREKPVKALFYSHDTLGLGHLKRTLTICQGLGVRFRKLCTYYLKALPLIRCSVPATSLVVLGPEMDPQKADELSPGSRAK